MFIGVVLSISLLLQGLAVFLALRLIRVTGWRTAWTSIAAAIALMALRRGLTLIDLYKGERPGSLDPVAELVALAISVLMVFGLYRIAPSFHAFKQAREKIRDVQALSENLIQTANVMIVMLDASGNVTRLNKTGERITGYTEAELLGRSWFETLAPRDKYPHVWDEFRRLLSGGIPKTFENPVLTKSGKERYILWENSEITAGGEIIGTISFGNDITDHKHLAEALKEKERQYFSLLSELPGMAYRCKNDSEWTLEFVSEGCLALTGYYADELRHNAKISLSQLIHPDDQGWVWEKCQMNLVAKKLCRNEYRLVTKDGGIKWIWDQAHGVYSGSGKLLAVEGFITDITERKRAEEALRENELRLKLALESAHMGVWAWTVQTNAVYWSPECYEICGMSSAVESLNDFTCLVHPEDLPKLMEAVNRAMADRTIFALEFRILRPDGSLRWLSDVGQVKYDAESRPLQVVGTVQDITERKQAEEKVRESEARLRAIIDNEPECVKLVDRDGNLLEMNQAGLRMIEANSLAQVKGHCVFPLVAEEHREAYQRLHERVLSGETGSLVFDIINFKGARRTLETHETPLQDSSGAIYAALGITRDITERKRAEEELTKREKLLSDSQRLAHVGSWEWDMETNQTTWSDELYRISGFTPRELPVNYDAFLRTVHPDDRERVNQAVRRSMSDHQPFSFEYRVVWPDGTVHAHYAHGEVVLDPAGRPIRMHGFAQDVTDRKRAEEALQSSLLQIRALADHLQTIREDERTALSREIHDEFGQMLTGLKMDLSWLTKKMSPTSRNVKPPELVKKIESMSSLLDETIQSVRKIATGLRPNVLDLGLGAAIEWQAQEFQNRTGVHCRMMVEPTDSVDHRHATAVFRIFQEILTNVARHAKAGRVTGSLKIEENQLVLEVRDNGVGIHEQKVHDSKSMGLLGMRERALLLDGTLEIHGNPGRGTTVILRVPVKTILPEVAPGNEVPASNASETKGPDA